MSKWKDVWYMWDGVEVVEKVVLLLEKTGGVVLNGYPETPLGFESDDEYRYCAYTLGEKRRRCDLCEQRIDIGAEPIENCHICNGTGWEYKK